MTSKDICNYKVDITRSYSGGFYQFKGVNKKIVFQLSRHFDKVLIDMHGVYSSYLFTWSDILLGVEHKKFLEKNI